MRLQIQAVKMTFLHRVDGFSLRDRGRSLDIHEGLRIEALLLHIEMPAGGFQSWRMEKGQERESTDWASLLKLLPL